MNILSQTQQARLLSSMRRELRDEFTLFVQELRNSLPTTEIESLLNQGRTDALLARLTQSNQRFAEAWIRSHTRAAESAVTALRRQGVGGSFDPLLNRLVVQLRSERARVLREFAVRQGEATQFTLTQSMRAGLTNAETASRLRDIVGLNSRQARAIGAYRSGLAEMPARRSLQLVEAYRTRLVAYQAGVISQLESLRVVNGGVAEAWRQSIESGAINAADVVQTWNIEDARARDSHKSMDGQERGWNQPFLSGNGALLRYPGDPDAPAADSLNCRCHLSFELVTQGF